MPAGRRNTLEVPVPAPGPEPGRLGKSPSLLPDLTISSPPFLQTFLMAEYWKSTPRYWCKYCSTYVRDTKLERQNHDATAKHQGAIKRSLKDLHRGKEREEREKERAKREIDRLNGIVPSSASSSSSRPATGAADRRGGGGPLSETERKRQAEQLASLGVSIPDQFRGELAMAGEWTVTSTTIVPEKNNNDDNPDAIARGIHKRERTEEEIEQEEAVKGLFKKPRRWGRDAKTLTGEESEDLDALLGGGLVVVKKKKKDDEEDEDKPVKEEVAVGGSGQGSVKVESEQDVKAEEPELLPVKQEPSFNDDAPISDEVPAMPDEKAAVPPSIKTEGNDTEGNGGSALDAAAPAAVVFKKRKPKNIRQK